VSSFKKILYAFPVYCCCTALALSKGGGAAYDGSLLTLALDLGRRLLPAFATPTGIPYGTVNLRHGVPRGETPVASLAGAGSLTLEFTLLSRLTGEPLFGASAQAAALALHARRTPLGLLGKHVNVRSGKVRRLSRRLRLTERGA
jgi:hypothetical protein